MKIVCLLFVSLFAVARLAAQTNDTVRLAVIVESPEIEPLGDVMIVELSKNERLHLLERSEIEKIYREQGLSAANRDYLKLGQVLGADGLLLLNGRREPAFSPGAALPGGAQQPPEIILDVQLIAVKPGVLLTEEQLLFKADISGLASRLVDHLKPLLPKLSVLTQDAVPISVVNFSSAINSPETRDVERQLTSLTIERLSREDRLFVLERRNMQLLTTEKELKGMDDAAFWNGSYLLEGTLDREGYSSDKITISARLVPPNHGKPLPIEVSGSRTNLGETINELTAQIRKALNLGTNPVSWNMADEAAQYFDEAQWALKWKLLEEAQRASEAAWALGKQDMDCATVRINSYVKALPVVSSSFHSIMGGGKALDYVNIGEEPDPKNCDIALHALECYLQFSRTLPPGEPTINSPWYHTGVAALTQSSMVLEHYYYYPESQKPVANKLSDLRMAAREVADWISRSPSVRAAYFIGDRFPPVDEIRQTLEPEKNIFQCEVKWGCFWQENPEQSLDLYRELMQSPLFVYLHADFWFRDVLDPRLVTWDTADDKEVVPIWNDFIHQLDLSTNAFFQIEGLGLRYGDVKTRFENESIVLDEHVIRKSGARNQTPVLEAEEKLELADQNFYGFIFTNYDRIVTGREQLLDLDWGLSRFVGGGGITSDRIEALHRKSYTEVTPKMAVLRQEYMRVHGDALKSMKNQQSFAGQKRFFAENTPYDFNRFVKIFSDRDYSRAQAAELKPLMETYCSNLIVHADSKTEFKARDDSRWIHLFLGKDLDDIMNSPQVLPVTVSVPAVSPSRPARPAVANTILPMEDLTNALLVKEFLAILTQHLPATNFSGVEISGHSQHDGRLLLDLRYLDSWWESDGYSSRSETIYREAEAILDQNGGWKLFPGPHSGDFLKNGFDFMSAQIGMTDQKSFAVLLQDRLYLSDIDAIRKCDLKTGQWNELSFPQQQRSQLFAVNGHVYAANTENIFEINDDEHGFHILASTRRRPGESALDNLPNLGVPALFSGPDQSLCAVIGDNIFQWNGHDWNKLFSLKGIQMVQEFPNAVIFYTRPGLDPAGLWLWNRTDAAPELWVCESKRPQLYAVSTRPDASRNQSPKSRFQMPEGSYLSTFAVTYFKSNLFLFTEPDAFLFMNRQRGTMAPDERIGKLICFCRDCGNPIVIPLLFDPNSAALPPATQSRHLRYSPWLAFTEKELHLIRGNEPGVWVIPISEINAAISVKKQQFETKIVTEARATSQRDRDLLAKYDHNHNGIIEADEKEEALADPIFVEKELDAIDADHNGRLNITELGYFDANTNKVIDENELKGLQTAEKLLAARALAKLDLEHDGFLDGNGFSELFGNFGSGGLGMPYWDTNHDGKLDAAELAACFEYETSLEIRARPGSRSFLQRLGQGPNQHLNVQERLKASIESYWQRPDDFNNHGIAY